MPELFFRIADVSAMPFAAVPTVAVRLHITCNVPEESIQSISLNCQVQIQPRGRQYSLMEEARLMDLYGERERWGSTMKPLHWITLVVKVPPFEGETEVDLQLPCSLDFDVAANKYFYGLDEGSVAVVVMFSGTVFYTGRDGAVQIAQIPWDREANFQLPVEVWKAAIDLHYGASMWLRLPQDTFERLYRHKAARGIPTWNDLITQLLDGAEQGEMMVSSPGPGVRR